MLAGDEQRLSPEDVGYSTSQPAFQPVQCLRPETLRIPVFTQRTGRSQDELGLRGLGRPDQRRSEVTHLPAEPSKPALLLGAKEQRLRALSKLTEPLSMTSSDQALLAAETELRPGKGPDCLQHREARRG